MSSDSKLEDVQCWYWCSIEWIGSRREIKARGTDAQRMNALEQLKRARQGGQATLVEEVISNFVLLSETNMFGCFSQRKTMNRKTKRRKKKKIMRVIRMIMKISNHRVNGNPVQRIEKIRNVWRKNHVIRMRKRKKKRKQNPPNQNDVVKFWLNLKSKRPRHMTSNRCSRRVKHELFRNKNKLTNLAHLPYRTFSSFRMIKMNPINCSQI